MLDLVLTIAHHLAVFSLAGLLAAELVLLRPGISGARLEQLGRIDGAYGGLAGLIVVIGILRVIFGNAGAGFYLGNVAFWLKMTAFIAVGILSIQPTRALLQWRRAVRTDATFVPPEAAVARSRSFLFAEAAVFALIPVFAAAITRL